MYTQELAVFHDHPMFLINGRFQHHVAKVCLIVECQKDDSFRRSRPLLHSSLAGSSHMLSWSTVLGLTKGREIHSVQIVSPVCHRVRADGEAGNVVVCDKPFDIAHAQKNGG